MATIERQWSVKTALEQLDKAAFDCEGGPLANNAAYAWLKGAVARGALIEHTPLAEIYAAANAAVAAAGSQTNYANKIGITNAQLGDTLHARRDPCAAVLHDLGLVKRIVYVKKHKARETTS